jgi:hypothetical protein
MVHFIIRDELEIQTIVLICFIDIFSHESYRAFYKIISKKSVKKFGISI